MNTGNHSLSDMSKLEEGAREAAQKAIVRAEDVAEQVVDSTKETTKCATEKAKEMYHSAAVKAEVTLANTKEYVRSNPVPVLLGAIAFGAALGYVVMAARRKQTFGERYADEPMVAVREALLGALAPVTQRVHDGYDTARDGAGKAMHRLHRLGIGHCANSFSDRISRIGNNLKFW